MPEVSAEKSLEAHEVEVLGINLAMQCKNLFTITKEAGLRLFWVTEELLHLQEKVTKLESAVGKSEATLHADLGKAGVLHGDLTSAEGVPVAVRSSSTLPIEDSAAAEYNGELVSSIDSAGEASKGGLYFLAGLVVAGVVATGLFWVVKRGT